jgi:hypothetical protein
MQGIIERPMSKQASKGSYRPSHLSEEVEQEAVKGNCALTVLSKLLVSTTGGTGFDGFRNHGPEGDNVS